MNNQDKTSHVAWADRIGLNKRWEDAIKNCYYAMLYGPNDFNQAVAAFKILMINIKGGAQLKDQVNEHIKKLNLIRDTKYNNWYRKHPNAIRAEMNDKWNEFNNEKSELLFSFMIQLLEDNNFCFYKGGNVPVGSDDYNITDNINDKIS